MNALIRDRETAVIEARTLCNATTMLHTRLVALETELRELRDWPDGRGPHQARDPFDGAANISLESIELVTQLEKKLRRMVRRLS